MDLDASNDWTVVSKRYEAVSISPSGGLDVKADNVTAISNSFIPISPSADIVEEAPSDVDSTPRPNPLVDKLKIIDEKEGRD